MHLSTESLLIILLVGLLAGWLAGQIVQGTGFGIIGDIIIGIIGAFIGSWLLPQLGIHLGVAGDAEIEELRFLCGRVVHDVGRLQVAVDDA